MEMSTFNVDDGFLEAMARGYRTQIMTREDYTALIQSDTLEDLKMHLSSTEFDYTKELEALQVGANRSQSPRETPLTVLAHPLWRAPKPSHPYSKTLGQLPIAPRNVLGRV